MAEVVSPGRAEPAFASGVRTPLASAGEGAYRRTGEPREVLVDPIVSRGKFEQELADYARIAGDQRRLGWWLLRAEFPDVLVAFVAPQLRPPAVVFGALLDFTNYDLWPPSVTLVDPFSEEPLRARQLPPALAFQRKIAAGPPVQIPGMGEVIPYTEQPLLQAYGPEDIPFLCLPGVREYHDHPAHSGDSWFLHRGRGEGTLYFLLEKLHRYGVSPLRGYQMSVQISGYARSESPE